MEWLRESWKTLEGLSACNMRAMRDSLSMMLIDSTSDEKWLLYYEYETRKYYEALLPYIPVKSHILEVGCGAGGFYHDYRDDLTNMQNTYAAVDIDAPSIRLARHTSGDYVSFSVKDAGSFTRKHLAKFDCVLFVQSYIQIRNPTRLLRKYFASNPSGCVIIVSTVFPDMLCPMITHLKAYTLPFQSGITRSSMSLAELARIGCILNRTITNVHIRSLCVGVDAYISILR
jgi:2-polyprenyl-3-methyl-5-hydroxy-6-metoxy-1,4-benzoquinol methylase